MLTEDLLSPGVDWDPTPIITNGQGVYSFPGGNVTYNGVSLGSTATYRTSEGYLVNGERILEIRCTNNVWRAPVMITSKTGELVHHDYSVSYREIKPFLI